MIDALAGISPWWWVALAILLASAEMLTVTTVLIPAALAALTTAVLLWLAPGIGGAGQIGIFGLGTILLTFAGRALVGRFGDGSDRASDLNRRSSRLVGREAVVTEVRADGGQVSLDGVPWPARPRGKGPLPEAGTRVRIVAIDGIVLVVEP